MYKRMSLKAILIRVGIDQTFGNWNAPCNPKTREFVYIPIPQDKPNIQGLEKFYADHAISALHDFSTRNKINISLPDHLEKKRMHLDPDFSHLSYGDTANRGRRLLNFRENDIVVFYSGLRSIYGESKLIYALTGLLVVQSIEQVRNVHPKDFNNNAHTRNIHNTDSDVIVRGKLGISGRFERYIPIGEYRNRSYRVNRDLLKEWGNLNVKDGWIQRSVNPPLFLEPEKFVKWYKNQSPTLIASNN